MTDLSNDYASNNYVTAFFDSEADAEAAIARLEAEGIPRSEIRIVAGDASAGTEPTAPPAKGFFEALGDLFMPDEDRYSYAEGLRRGGYLVSLNTTAANRERVLDILDDEGTVDMDSREETWRSEGWQGYEASAPTTRASALSETGRGFSDTTPSLDTGSEDAIEVVEEKLRVGKRDSEHGRVRVRSYVVETPVEEDVTLRQETVRLERRPVDRVIEGDAAAAFVDRTVEAVETSEEAVVSKEARVVEEIILAKSVDTRTETVHDTVRRTEVEVDDDRLDRDK
jgi:stress response protein YsnF